MRKLSLILIITGIIIAAIPLAGQAYIAYKQNAMLDEWEVQLASTVDETADPSQEYMGLQDVFNGQEETQADAAIPANADSTTVSAGTQEEVKDKEPAPITEKKETTKKTEKAAPKKIQTVIGILQINKIKVKVPIVEGVKAENLRVGVGHLPGTAGFGQEGNTAIAGHRNYTFAQYFRHLDKLKAGDEITITTKSKTYKYKVFKSFVVEPTDISVLEPDGKEKMLTLITCHPYIRATQRLIVQAKLVEN